MNHNIGITYLCQNFNITIIFFVKHIKIIIQDRGYGNFQNNNIQLDVIFLCKAMNYISNNFIIQIEGIIETLSSNVIKFLKFREYSSEDLASLAWTLKLEETEPVLQPIDSVLYKDRGGNLNVRFSRYLPGVEEEESFEREDVNLMNKKEETNYSELLKLLGKKHLKITSQIKIKGYSNKLLS